MLGAVLGVGIMEMTGTRLAKIQDAYAGRDVTLTAEVESTGRAYTAGRVSAVLMVEKVDGEAVHFRVECASLPKCEAGGRIRGRFSLDVPDATQRLDDYADGIVLSAEYLSGMLRLGQSESFRARTARLQAALSRALRKGMAENTGGVLAAMVVGDRSHLTSTLRSAYRGAGLSHVLVVSGLHVTIFCGLLDALPHKERERSRAYRRARSLLRAGTALLLVGITGATPSVLRAAVAVWVSSLGVWVGGPADTLTSLGAAGVLMCLGNGYAVYDVGFELSFAAVMGTLAGAECAGRGRERYYDRKKKRKSRREKPSRAVLLFRRFAGGVWDSLCVSLCASAATFPVLVLRGMSTTVWAVASGVVVLWLVGPMLSFGLGAALLGLAAEGLPLFEIIRRLVAFCAEGLAWLMNEWAFRVSVLPGASLWFDGTYAALVCLALILLCVMAMRRHIRLRVALPTVILLAALAFGLETALSWNVVNIELVGTRAAPAVVITQREKAVVLFRGSSITQRAVENQLEKRGVRTVELLVDLRMQPEEPCRIEAQKRINAAALAENTTRCASCGEVDLELFCTRQGCILRMRVGGQRFITLSGTVRPAKPIRAEWLLASMARPDNIQYTDCLTLSSKYRWMEEDAEPVSRLRLREHFSKRAEYDRIK
ncbi:ComEC/Rec2 family competence protein [Faecalibacterium prausnitzii]|uniref:ComEC/Rec2 family competence protein n=1 Tax=Faecalibacterium prausnitzii TaxID=853 RepID=UPI0032B3455F